MGATAPAVLSVLGNRLPGPDRRTVARSPLIAAALPVPQPPVPLMPVPHRLPRRAAGPTGILLVNPQALVRHGVAMTLAAQHPAARILEAGSLREAADLLGRARDIDLIVLDLDLAAGEEAASGETKAEERRTAVIRQLAQHDIPVVVVASSRHPADVLACVRAGAAAYVAKTGSSAILEHAVALVQFGERSGERYVPLPRSALERAPPLEPQEEEARALERLSTRQREIFRLLVAGGSNKEIARELGVLEGTVKVHVRAVMQKLGVRNRTQIAVVAARHGYLQEAAGPSRMEQAEGATPVRLGTGKKGGR